MIDQDFLGAKLALFVGADLVVILRDDRADIPFPGHWDFPGGGREAGESPAACVLRETREELGLVLAEAHLAVARVDDIVLGDEGQCWQLMPPDVYCDHPKGVPNFQSRLKDYLSQQ